MKNQANVVIHKGCHSRTPLSGIYNARRCQTKGISLLNRCVEDPRVLRTAKSGMTSNLMSGSHLTYKDALNKGAFRAPLRSDFTARSVIPQSRYAGYSGRTGFTLIELLVVVLIIGILAAVAVPQYQKAVLKTRMTQAVLFGKEYIKAQHMYRLANGEFASQLADLDIQLPPHTGWTMQMLGDGGLSITHTASSIYFNFWPAGGLFSQNTGFCLINYSNPHRNVAQSVCQSFTKNPVDTKNGRYEYQWQW